MEAFASHAAVALENAKLTQDIEKLFARLGEQFPQRRGAFCVHYRLAKAAKSVISAKAQENEQLSSR